jgi:hypothetical protein
LEVIQLIILTERDRNALRLIGKWRFATLQQLQKAGIFLTTRKRAYIRLLQLCKGEYLKAGILGKGQLYYYLTSKGGEAADFPDLYWSSRYRDAKRDLVLKTLTACDFSLAAGVEYISKQDVLERLKSAPYDILKSCLQGQQHYYVQGNMLHVLNIDYNLSLKYLAQKIKTYSRLPSGLRNGVVLDFLVFSETRQTQVKAVSKKSAIMVTAILGNWKY